MERPANASSSATVQGSATNGTSNDGPTARLNALATAMGVADPFHAMMLAGYRATEPLGLYASYSAQQIAVAQNEHIRQCAADLRDEMAKLKKKEAEMDSLLKSASRKIVEFELRDPEGLGPRRKEFEMEKRLQDAIRLSEEKAEKRLQDAMRTLEEKAEKRLLDAVRVLEEKAERRLLDAIRASEDKTNRQCEKMSEQLESRLEAIEKRVGGLQKQAYDLEPRISRIERALSGMGKKLKPLEKNLEEKLEDATNDLEKKLEDATNDLEEKMKLTNDAINELKLKLKDDKPVNERGPVITVQGLELAVRELEELAAGPISAPVLQNFLPPPPGPSASNRAQSTHVPGASGTVIGRDEIFEKIRQVNANTEKGFEGLMSWILYFKSRSAGVERFIARRENGQRGCRTDVEYLDVPCPDGTIPGSWRLDGQDFPALRNVATIRSLTPAQCAFALMRYGHRNIPETVQDCMTLIFMELGVIPQPWLTHLAAY